MSKKQDQEATLFPAKWDKVLKQLPEFKEMADAASTEELKKMLFQAESNSYTVEREKDSDQKLNAAKEMVKDLTAPYRDSIKIYEAKAKYTLFLLEGRGVELDNRE